jgi:hypothetical protein
VRRFYSGTGFVSQSSTGVGSWTHAHEEADVGPESCHKLAPSSVKRRQRDWLLKSHWASWASLSSVENMAENAQSRLDEIFTEAS